MFDFVPKYKPTKLNVVAHMASIHQVTYQEETKKANEDAKSTKERFTPIAGLKNVPHMTSRDVQRRSDVPDGVEIDACILSLS